jgi:hypothetical protein
MTDSQERDEREQTTPAEHRIPIPTREDFDRFVKKVAPPPKVVDALTRQLGLPSDLSDRDSLVLGLAHPVA